MSGRFNPKKFARIFLLLFFIIPMWGVCQKTTDEDYATSSGQNKPKQKEPFGQRIVYGGNIGGYLGTITFLQLNPMVGYRVTDWFVPGIGANYMYAKSQGISQSIYGASAWMRLYPFQNFFAHTEYEYLSLKASDSYGHSFRANVPVLLVGAGYQDNGLGLMVLFDLIGDPYSPYSTPVIRVGGLFGF
ncbi:MAG: hypothetical protein K1X54_12720 [Flavobacteriales bacterium]|nr:hypothetical protein [Flavobacteriales bacterium]